jgi:hypothetical protein
MEGIAMMKKKAMCACIVLLLICSFLLCSCSVSNRVLIRYYSEKSNYVTASGVVSHIKDAPERDHLVFGFSELSPSMDDVSFNFVGANREIVLQRGILQKVQLGTTVSFMTAPHYFGDGYIMPIVEISVDGEELLSFEEGYENLLEWLRMGNS